MLSLIYCPHSGVAEAPSPRCCGVEQLVSECGRLPYISRAHDCDGRRTARLHDINIVIYYLELFASRECTSSHGGAVKEACVASSSDAARRRWSLSSSLSLGDHQSWRSSSKRQGSAQDEAVEALLRLASPVDGIDLDYKQDSSPEPSMSMP